MLKLGIYIYGTLIFISKKAIDCGITKYDASGNVEEPYLTKINPWQYCGEYRNEESGLIYLKNRYYDSSMGKFIYEAP